MSTRIFFLQGSLTASLAPTTTSSPGGSPGTSSRTGTGSTAETSAGSAAWTWSPSRRPSSSRCLPKSCSKVRFRGKHKGKVYFCHEIKMRRAKVWRKTKKPRVKIQCIFFLLWNSWRFREVTASVDYLTASARSSCLHLQYAWRRQNISQA